MACGGGGLLLKILLAYGDAPGFVANVDEDVSAAIAFEGVRCQVSISGKNIERAPRTGEKGGEGSSSQSTEWHSLSSSCKTIFQ